MLNEYFCYLSVSLHIHLHMKSLDAKRSIRIHLADGIWSGLAIRLHDAWRSGLVMNALFHSLVPWPKESFD